MSQNENTYFRVCVTYHGPTLQCFGVAPYATSAILIKNIINIRAATPECAGLNEFIIIESITSRQFFGQIESTAYQILKTSKAKQVVEEIYGAINELE